MDEIIWVEVLSRQREVVARFRCVGPTIRIGRSYDNDVILDDPYVAPRHLSIARDENGALIATDLSHASGLFADHDRQKLERIAVDGDRLLRIGRTYLRIREPSHAVVPEYAARPQQRLWPVALGLAGGILGMALVSLWLGETAEPQLYRYLLPLLALSIFVLAWTTGWAILSRIFSGQARFEHHLLIALTATLAFSIYDELIEYGSFALSSSTLGAYEYIGTWCIFAALCFCHLREIGPARIQLKGAAVVGLAAIAIATQTLGQSEARSLMDQQSYVRALKPPRLRLAPPQNEATFFADVEQLKNELDKARLEPPSSNGLDAIFGAED